MRDKGQISREGGGCSLTAHVCGTSSSERISARRRACDVHKEGISYNLLNSVYLKTIQTAGNGITALCVKGSLAF